MAFADDAVTKAIETAVATIDPEPDTSAGDDAPESSDATDSAEPADTTEAASTDTPPSPDTTDEDELKAIETELVAKTPTLKGRINLSRHQAVLTRQRRAAETEAKKFQEQIAQLEPLKQYSSQEWQDRLAAIQLAETQPEVFFKEVLMKDPRYQALLPKAQADPPAPQQTITEAPQPDVLLTDGRLTYSPEQAAKFATWKTEEMARSLQEKYDKSLEDIRGVLTPIKEEREHNVRLGQSMRKMSVVLADARANWPDFTENEAEIYKLISTPGNETMSLEQGYHRLVLPKLDAARKQTAEERTKIRAEERSALIKEWNKGKPASLTPGQLPEAAGGSDTPRDTKDVIKEAIRKAGLK